MSKKKGTKAERELFHHFWDKDWVCIRVAGSGSTTKPAPDLLTSNGKSILAIECKAVKAHKKYITSKQIEELRDFSMSFGAEPWVGIRFDNLGWYFIHADNLPRSKGDMYYVTLDILKEKGLDLDNLFEKFS